MIDHHIAQIARKKGWKNVTVKPYVWTSQFWILQPVLDVQGELLIINFESYQPGAAAPTGTWIFDGSEGTQTSYDRANSRIDSNTVDSWYRSDRISQHSHKLTYRVQAVEPAAYTFLELLILTEG